MSLQPVQCNKQVYFRWLWRHRKSVFPHISNQEEQTIASWDLQFNLRRWGLDALNTNFQFHPWRRSSWWLKGDTIMSKTLLISCTNQRILSDRLMCHGGVISAFSLNVFLVLRFWVCFILKGCHVFCVCFSCFCVNVHVLPSSSQPWCQYSLVFVRFCLGPVRCVGCIVVIWLMKCFPGPANLFLPVVPAVGSNPLFLSVFGTN